MKDEKFEKAVEFVLDHEGGLVDSPEDSGGITNYGISLEFMKAYAIDLTGEGIVDEQDIKNITKEQAVDIYRRYFWEKYSYNKIDNPVIATKALDMSVNIGPKLANTLLQSSYKHHVDHELVVDGIIGSKTLAVINQDDLPVHDILATLRRLCVEFYVQLVVKNPKELPFLRGWVRRAFS